MTRPRPRVVVADDHVLIRAAIVHLLAEFCTVVAEAGDGAALVEAVRAHNPDIVLADVTMPLADGITAARHIVAAFPATRVIMLTIHADADVARAAFEAGVLGYLLKSSAVGELHQAIRVVLDGDRYLTTAIESGDVARILGRDRPRSGWERLTPREREVAQLLADGLTMKEVARRLAITPRTVAFHKYRLMERLDVHTTAQLVRAVLEAVHPVSEPG